MSEISLDHYIGREVVKGNKAGGSQSITLDGGIKIFNEDPNRDMEAIPKGSRLAMVTMDQEETRVVFHDADGKSHVLTLTATQHALSDPERTEGEKVVLQGGRDLRDLTIPPEPSERLVENHEEGAVGEEWQAEQEGEEGGKES